MAFCLFSADTFFEDWKQEKSHCAVTVSLKKQSTEPKMSNQENKKNYKIPTLSVMNLNVSDIITVSNGDNEGNAGEGGLDDEV